MTLERRPGGTPGDVRLVECPFCEADLRAIDPARHLRECEAYREAWGLDATGAEQGGRP